MELRSKGFYCTWIQLPLVKSQAASSQFSWQQSHSSSQQLWQPWLCHQLQQSSCYKSQLSCHQSQEPESYWYTATEYMNSSSGISSFLYATTTRLEPKLIRVTVQVCQQDPPHTKPRSVLVRAEATALLLCFRAAMLTSASVSRLLTLAPLRIFCAARELKVRFSSERLG